MPKRAALEPKEVTGRSAKWVVNVPAGVSETGRRQRQFFDTKDEAKTFCQQVRTQLENYGARATVLTPGQIEQAAQAFEKLKNYDVPLNEVVESWLTQRKQAEKSVTFEKLMEDFANSGRNRRGRSAGYRRSILQIRKRLKSLHGCMASEITVLQLEKAVESMPDSVRNYTLRIVSCAFNLGVSRGYAAENPVRRVEKAEIPSKEVAVYKAHEVATILAQAQKHASEIVPFYALGFFAGIRRSELLRMDWEHIELAEGYIRLPKSISKTGQGRHIPIERNLKFWLKECPKKTGKVVPFSHETLRRRERALKKFHKLNPIKHGPRHCYGSYWLAQYENIDRLILSMGHTDFDTTQEHYAKAVTKKEARMFWAILPTRSKAQNRLEKRADGKPRRSGPLLQAADQIPSVGNSLCETQADAT